jgi:hypothetical protein
LLSAPVGLFLDSVPACRLHIPILFNHMRTFMTDNLGYMEPKIKQILNALWSEKMFPALRNYDKGGDRAFSNAFSSQNFKMPCSLFLF